MSDAEWDSDEGEPDAHRWQNPQSAMTPDASGGMTVITVTAQKFRRLMADAESGKDKMDKQFTQSFDARDWAKAFVEHVTANPAIATDEGTMIGWFANAIMRGYDEYPRRQAASASLDREGLAIRADEVQREMTRYCAGLDHWHEMPVVVEGWLRVFESLQAAAAPRVPAPQVEAITILEAIEAALNGESVSGFMESFPVVRHVQDLVQERYLCKCNKRPAPAPSADREGLAALVEHLRRQRDFSERTFGPGRRTAGVVDHIRKELLEIEAKPDDLSEWIDVVILGFDGAWRAGYSPEQIVEALVAKQAKNERREWPDWRTAPPNKAIEHVRAAPRSEGERRCRDCGATSPSTTCDATGFACVMVPAPPRKAGAR